MPQSEMNPTGYNPNFQPSEVFPPTDFGLAASEAFAVSYPDARQEGRLSAEDPLVLTATRNAEMHFSAGRREQGWNELEGRLGNAGWSDNERSLSIKLTGSEIDCGLEKPVDQAESLDIALDFLDQSASEETKAILEQFSSLPDGHTKVAAVEDLLVKVETAMGRATTEGKSQTLRKRLRGAQQALFVEKSVIQDSYAVRNSAPVKYDVYPPAPKREIRSKARRR